MNDEERSEETTEEPEAPEEPSAEEPEAEAAPPDEPADDDQAAAEEEQAPAEEAPAQEPAAEGEPTEAPTPKQLRKAARSRSAGPPGPQLSAEERAARRRERRSAGAEARRRYRSTQRSKPGEPRQGTPPRERRPGARKVRQGTVVSNKGDKTITVRIEVARRHPTYEKVVRRTATLHAHDEANEANEGDIVRVVESRPLSRTKRWRLDEILERAR